ncbi:alkaline phosphatase, tissue-nonspecific isozyme-like isoform X2 [Babylonia areolata]
MNAAREVVRMTLSFILVLHCFITVARGMPRRSDYPPESQDVWIDIGQQELNRAMQVRQNNRVAKNVIMFLGDGLGISTVTAARIYKGQTERRRGEETQLNFETFPYVALSKTYSADRQTSASASTAMACVAGVKANFGTLGFDARVMRGNCSLVNDASTHVTTMLDWSHAAGKSVGIVTNTRVTHASPAALYAHSPDRNWERDSGKCVPDIATQLLKDNANITVVLGGGRRSFQSRSDGKDLVQEWLNTKQGEGKRARYVKNATELRSLQAADTDHLLGLFTESHMTWELSRDDNSEPSLSEMTAKALEVLKKNDKGFFLFVEGGRIDHAHHDNQAKRALSETVEMDNAVQRALQMTDPQDTLIIVTADHSHPFNIQGYPSRGNDILGLVDIIDPGQEVLDHMPYTTLNYANGPGPDRSQNLTGVNTTTNDFMYQRLVPFQAGWETHSGEDVGIYATGPMAHLFHGVHEQNYIAHVMAYAACVGRNKAHCDLGPPTTGDGSSGAVGVNGKTGREAAVFVVVIVSLVAALVQF